ncbi:hypothetical protein FQV39_28835 [Bosea sp. F3-2]|uniref:hypothetical protein n=1 Tax=Bosea sp. F3-2 TaxID=2599640 RepID=UPI0011EE3BE8|nr:hypothetical protein [Bosea sp. F3-2]QEL26170.1 hypothetical protein FQV39_28835 [Bosea sp. F3-2]
MPNDNLEDAKIRYKWAEEKIFELKRSMDEFFKTLFYAPYYTKTADGSKSVMGIELITPLPLEWKKLTSEACQHLRSALDSAVWAVAVHKGIQARQITFPVAKAEEDFQQELKKARLRNKSPELCDFIVRQKPYLAGNPVLYSLHDLNRNEKHRRLSVFQTNGGVYFNYIKADGPCAISGDLKFKDGRMDVIYYDHGVRVQSLMYPTFAVAFESAPGLGKVTIEVGLEAMAQEVSRILGEVEASFF